MSGQPVFTVCVQCLCSVFPLCSVTVHSVFSLSAQGVFSVCFLCEYSGSCRAEADLYSELHVCCLLDTALADGVGPNADIFLNIVRIAELQGAPV